MPHALIGAAAMAGRGVLRATDDFDLLVTDRAVLQADYWKDVTAQGFDLEVHVGDETDPLAGVARLSRAPVDRALDVVVGKFRWQAEIVERAELHRLGRVEVPLVLSADLILLKLYAASAQDLLDVEALLEAGDRGRLEADVERQIDRLPRGAREAWRRLVPGGDLAR